MAKFNGKDGYWYTDQSGNHYFVGEGETPKEGWEATKRRKMIDGGKYKVDDGDGKGSREVSRDEYDKYEAEDADFDETVEDDFGFDEEEETVENDGRSSIEGIKPEALTYEGDDEPDISYLAGKYGLDFDHTDTGGYSVKGNHQDIQKFFDDFNLGDYGHEINVGSDEKARAELARKEVETADDTNQYFDDVFTEMRKNGIDMGDKQEILQELGANYGMDRDEQEEFMKYMFGKDYERRFTGAQTWGQREEDEGSNDEGESDENEPGEPGGSENEAPKPKKTVGEDLQEMYEREFFKQANGNKEDFVNHFINRFGVPRGSSRKREAEFYGKRFDKLNASQNDSWSAENPKYKDFNTSDATNVKVLEEGDEYEDPNTGKKSRLKIIEYTPYGLLRFGRKDRMYGIVGDDYEGGDTHRKGAIVAPSLKSAKEQLKEFTDYYKQEKKR